MKNKVLITIFLLLLFVPISIHAEEKKDVLFVDCVDGDTAKVILDDEEITLRFLAIDTPETKHPTKGEEAFGKEASEYTCNSLKNASSIQIEYDENSDILDKYNRHLVWIYVNNELLQSNLIEKGYAKVAYLYDDYKYTEDLEKLESTAKENKVGIWGNYEEKDNTVFIVITIILVIVLLIIDKKYRTKTINKAKKSLINKIRNKIN